MEEKQSNLKKIIITILIIIVAFLIIFGSALLTIMLINKKDNKNSEISKSKSEIVNSSNNIEEEPKVEQEIENNSEEKNVDVIENKNILNNIFEEIQNKIDNENVIQDNPSQSEAINERIPVSNPNAISLCKKAQTSDERNIYLTFDDGPSPNVTPQILAILKRYNVPATFFILGSRAELYPELVKQEYNEGHYLANHGYSHKYSSIYSSVQSVIDEYNKCDNAIQTALNNPDYHTYLFRFPGGSSGGPYNDLKQNAKVTLENMGIASTNWNCLNGDAEGTGRTKEQLVNRLYETARSWNSLVVLMHDADDKQTTVDALPEIIEHYQAEGYTFKNYYEIFQ